MKRRKDFRKVTKADWSYIIARHNGKSHAWGGALYLGHLLALCGRLLPQYAKECQVDEVQCEDCKRYLFNHDIIW